MAKASFISALEARTQSGDQGLIFSEICEIQKKILSAIDNNQFQVIVNDDTPMTSIDEVSSLTLTAGGTNYQPVTATATVTHPSGINADVTPIVTDGVVTGFTINDGGSGYDPITAAADLTGIGNGDATVSLTVTNGVISGYTITFAGSGYLSGDLITITHPSGTGADLRVASVGGFGEITGITIVNGGTGYAPVLATFNVTHPTGTGFSGTAVTSGGVITGATITNGGVGYEPLNPTVTISDPTGVGATAEVTVTAGVITAITLTNGGYGYTNPTVTINAAPTSAGSGATATATADANSFGTTPEDYYDVYIGNTSDSVKSYQMQKVIDYFQELGYNIRRQTNSNTGATMQWLITW